METLKTLGLGALSLFTVTYVAWAIFAFLMFTFVGMFVQAGIALASVAALIATTWFLLDRADKAVDK